MGVLHLGLLMAGVACVVVPIIIHLLFRQRRHPIPWGAMRFLLEAYRKARKRIRLEQLLLLAIRCLIILLLAAAIARPLLQGTELQFIQGGRTVYILLDNSITSGVTEHQGEGVESTFDRQKKQAAAILDALGSSDRVGLITLARPARAVVDQPVVDHRAVRELINEMKPVDSGADIGAGLLQLREVLDLQADDPTPVLVYLLSDFLTGVANASQPLPPALVGLDRPLALVASPPADSMVTNVQITSISPVRALALTKAGDLSGRVRIRLRRSGDLSSDTVTTLRVMAEGVDEAEPRIIRWAPGDAEQTVDIDLDLQSQPSGSLVVTAVVDRDALPADNRRATLLDVRDKIHVAVLDRREFGGGGEFDRYSSGAWFRRALDPGEGSPVLIEDIDPATLDSTTLRLTAAAILCRPDLVTDEGWALLAEFTRAGGLLWIMPAETETVALWTDAAAEALNLPWRWAREVVDLAKNESESTSLSLANEQPKSELFSMLSAELNTLVSPVEVFRYLPLEEGIESASVILELENGDPFLIAGSHTSARGLVVYQASATHLDWTSLPTKPLMVAMAHETVRQGIGLARQRVEPILGERTAIAAPEEATSLRRPDGERVALENVEGTIRPVEEFIHAGTYTMLDRHNTSLGPMVVNIDPDSARTDIQSANTIMAWLQASGPWTWLDPDAPATQVNRDEARAEISLFLLIMVLVLALLETVLARWFSHARRDRIDPGLVSGSIAPTLSFSQRPDAPRAGKGARS